MTITERQDQPEHLDRLAAYSYRYRVAGRWRAVRMAGTLLLAAAVPVLAFARPSWADQLAAVAALWLVLGRTAFSCMERSSYLKAAAMQEYYDTQLFGLPWNEALAGSMPRQVDIAADAVKLKDRSKLRQWYDVDLTGLPWPADVVLCQMQSSSWSRRDHEAYSALLIGSATIWTAAGLIYGFAADLSLQAFLVRLFLPSAPALLDAVELALAHHTHALDRRKVEDAATAAWRTFQRGDQVTTELVRQVQDSAFQLRRDQPRVPKSFYSLRRTASSRATISAAAAVRR